MWRTYWGKGFVGGAGWRTSRGCLRTVVCTVFTDSTSRIIFDLCNETQGKVGYCSRKSSGPQNFGLLRLSLWLRGTFRASGSTDERQALPGSSWSVPRWPAELLPVSGLASLPGPRSLAGHRLGTWHVTISQDKGATFGGHCRVLGPAVRSLNRGFTFVMFTDLARTQANL